MAREDGEKRIEQDAVAASVARVFRGVAGVTPPDGEDTLADGFEAACRFAGRVFSGDNDVAVSVSRLATDMSRQFSLALGFEAAPLDAMPPRVSLAWQSAARHVANLLLAEDSGVVAECERKIFEWAAARL